MNHNTKILARTHCLGKQQQPIDTRQYYFLYLLITCLLSFSAASAYAATYYVDASTGDDSNPGTSAEPWKTLDRTYTWYSGGETPVVQEGDTVLFRNGNYGVFRESTNDNPWATFYVERNNWITYKGDTGHTPEFSQIYIKNINNITSLAGRSYLRFENIQITGGIYIWFTNYVLLNNCIVETQPEPYSGDNSPYFARNSVACYLRDINNITISNSEIRSSSNLISVISVDIICTNLTITDNYLHNFAADGLKQFGNDSTFSGNTIADSSKLRTGVEIRGSVTSGVKPAVAEAVTQANGAEGVVYSQPGGTASHLYVFQTNGTTFTAGGGLITGASGTFSPTLVDYEHPDGIHIEGQSQTNMTFESNTIESSADGQGLGLYSTDGLSNGVYIRNNLIKSTGNNVRLIIEGWNGVEILNNTLISTGACLRLANSHYYGSSTGPSINKMYNNIMSMLTADDDAIVAEHGNNIFGNNPDGIGDAVKFYVSGTEIVDYDIDTLFVDAANNNFTLAAGSAAINFGDANNDPSTDILGVTRDAEHHSAGAYEFTGPALDSIGDKDVDEGEELAFSISADDVDGDPITYSATGTAITAGGVLTAQNFAWTPNGSQAGTYQATFTATAGGQTDFETITITVNNIVNTAPILASIGSKSGSEGLLIGFTTSASDSDVPANDLTFSLQDTPPTGASIDAVTGYFTWVPTEAQGPDTYNVKVRVTDDGTGTLYDEEIVTITVGEVNASPTLSAIGSKSVDELVELTFTATATDTDIPSNTLTYSLINAPAGASIGSGTGVFAWTPSESHGSNSYSVTVRVTDNGSPNLYDEETISISVIETNTTPVLDPIGNKATNVGSELTFTADATDADVPANTLTYSLTTAPAGASIGSGTGVFTWTPSSGYEQTFNVTVRVTDDGAGTLFDEETITITVGPDVTDPTVTNLSPADADVQVSIDSLIILTIADAGIGVDLDTVTIDVDGDRIYDGGSETSAGVYVSTGDSIKGVCRRTGTSAAYSFFFQADARFDYEKNITVTVNASDLASTSNDMAEQSYSFYTAMREFEGNAKVNSDTGTLVQDRPAVAKDSDGNIWAVWDQTTIAGDTDIYIGKLAANDSVFGESTQVTSDTNNQRNAVIAIDSNNKMYLAWQDFRQGEWDVYLATSTDGENFSTETRITDPNSNQINPDIAIDSSDKVYIVWEDDQNSNNDIYIASSTNSFVSKTTSQITSNDSSQSSPAIAIDSAKTVYVVWTDARNASNDIYGATSISGPWTNAAIVNNANGQTSPVIATETSGTVLHLLWVDDTSGDNDIFYGATTGGLAGLPLTGTDISDDTTSSDQSNPSIFATGTTGSDLRVFACWKDSRDVVNNNGDTDIYYGETALGGSTFGTNVLVNDGSGASAESVPVVDVDINGNPYLAWVDNRGGNKDIYYAGAMLMGSVLVTSPLITVDTGDTVEVDDTTSNIDSATDIRVVIPADALPADTTITISKMINPPSPPSGGFGVNYEFGPSGLVFDSPVTIYLPHAAADCPGHAIYRAYWYNQELSAWYPPGGIEAQHGVDPVSGVHYITFETDHFTGFGVGGGSAGGGGGGGGGCSMSPDGQGTIVEFLVPYIGLAIVMAIMKLKGRRKKNLHRYTGSD